MRVLPLRHDAFEPELAGRDGTRTPRNDWWNNFSSVNWALVRSKPD